MAHVYILYSVKLNKHYIGSCLNLKQRLIQHKSKIYSNAYTSKADDWKLVLELSELDYQQARLIEKHIKKMKSIKYIGNLIQYPKMKQKLITKYRAGSFR